MQCEGLSAGIVTGMGTTAPQTNDLQTPHNLLSFPCNLSPWETTLWSRELCLWCKAKSFCKPLTAWLQDAFTTAPQEIQSCSCSLRSSLDASVSISSKSSWNFTTQDQKNPFFFLAFCSPVTDTHLNSCQASGNSRHSQCLLLVLSCLFLSSPPTS